MSREFSLISSFAGQRRHLSDNLKKKIALFCNVAPSSVLECIDAESIYDVPLLMHKENLDVEILKKVKVKCAQEPDLARLGEISF